MSDRRIKAAAGELRWGYHQAATLRGCEVACQEGTWALAATVVVANAFRIAQRPLTFVIVHRKGAWSWPVLDLQFSDGAVTARLGPPEKP